MSVGRHSMYNLAGTVLPTIVSLVTVPIYLKVVGLERYGILAICWLLVGYFNLFDFGLGRALTQRLATLDEAGAEARNRIFWTAAMLTAGLALLAAVIAYPALRFGLPRFGIGTSRLHGEVAEATWLLIAAVPFGLGSSLLTGTLQGRRQFLQSNIATTLNGLATAIFPLVAALLFGPQIVHLLAATLVARGGVMLLMLLFCARSVPILRPQLALGADLRGLIGFGGWTTLGNAINPLLAFADRFMIGAWLGAAAVSLYVVPLNLVSQLTIVSGALAGALLPRMAAATIGDHQRVGNESVRVVAYLMTPATLFLLIVLGPFLLLWLGRTTGAAATPVAFVLMTGIWANCLAAIALTSLVARGRPDLLTKVYLVEVVPYLLLLWGSLVLFGIVGAALAWSLRCIADAVILLYLMKLDAPTRRLLAAHFAVVLGASALAFGLLDHPVARVALLAVGAGVVALVLIRNMPPSLAAMRDKVLRAVTSR